MQQTPKKLEQYRIKVRRGITDEESDELAELIPPNPYGFVAIAFVESDEPNTIEEIEEMVRFESGGSHDA